MTPVTSEQARMDRVVTREVAWCHATRGDGSVSLDELEQALDYALIAHVRNDVEESCHRLVEAGILEPVPPRHGEPRWQLLRVAEPDVSDGWRPRARALAMAVLDDMEQAGQDPAAVGARELLDTVRTLDLLDAR